MTRMLETLDVRDSDRVLEIGTGAGYNAALLCHRLGDRQVYSVDVEPDLVDAARSRLAALGYHPTLVCADGGLGLPEHAPYDRIIATCSVPRVPWSWVGQTKLDGVILADLKVSVVAGNLSGWSAPATVHTARSTRGMRRSWRCAHPLGITILLPLRLHLTREPRVSDARRSIHAPHGTLWWCGSWPACGWAPASGSATPATHVTSSGQLSGCPTKSSGSLGRTLRLAARELWSAHAPRAM